MRARFMPPKTRSFPMAAATIVTVVSLPIYWAFHQWQGAMGLAIASDIGIALQTGTIAVLLHRRHMVSLASLDYSRNVPLPADRCDQRHSRLDGDPWHCDAAGTIWRNRIRTRRCAGLTWASWSPVPLSGWWQQCWFWRRLVPRCPG
jgi:hypothetical protein